MSENTSEQEGKARLWQKGGPSPNPGGRPKEVGHVRELARKYTEDCIRVLAEIALDKQAKHAARVAAAEALLDRAWGRPTQSVEVSGDAGLRIVISERIAAALEAGKGGERA